MTEKRWLQLAVAAACFVPLSASILSLIRGPAWIGGVTDVPTDLDSHFRYLSGIFLAMGIGFVTCIPGIEDKTGRFRLLAAMVVTGGLARLASLLIVGAPSQGHLIGLGIELGVVPLLTLWQARVARRTR
ncbi:DUF4345 domain-containing protein [Sphingomonas japonica]|uniref:DUF4345 domain-containing protein n=1 Tax=Sphingomonas japonica TaxID=511662 RepID=A0ABX0TZ97_9SPHN|nr:DUF4345 domain-containing protein [Sphingomonas japonica]NIJ23641.1 hypothetical protein [Sphingomonas japonica]